MRIVEHCIITAIVDEITMTIHYEVLDKKKNSRKSTMMELTNERERAHASNSFKSIRPEQFLIEWTKPLYSASTPSWNISQLSYPWDMEEDLGDCYRDE